MKNDTIIDQWKINFIGVLYSFYEHLIIFCEDNDVMKNAIAEAFADFFPEIGEYEKHYTENKDFEDITEY